VAFARFPSEAFAQFPSEVYRFQFFLPFHFPSPLEDFQFRFPFRSLQALHPVIVIKDLHQVIATKDLLFIAILLIPIKDLLAMGLLDHHRTMGIPIQGLPATDLLQTMAILIRGLLATDPPDRHLQTMGTQIRDLHQTIRIRGHLAMDPLDLLETLHLLETGHLDLLEMDHRELPVPTLTATASLSTSQALDSLASAPSSAPRFAENLGIARSYVNRRIIFGMLNETSSLVDDGFCFSLPCRLNSFTTSIGSSYR